MATTDDSDNVMTSPPIASGGKEKPHKGGQQQNVMSHFVPFSEAAIGMGLAENPVAPSDTDVKAILSYASVATETRKDGGSRSTDKQQTTGGKQTKRETGEKFDMMTSSHKHESNKKPHKKHKTRRRQHEEPSAIAPNLLPHNLLPADLIEQDDDNEGGIPPAADAPAPVVQVSNTKLIIRPPKATSLEPLPLADAATSTKKTSKKKKKKEKSQHSLKLKFKVDEDTAHIVQ